MSMSALSEPSIKRVDLLYNHLFSPDPHKNGVGTLWPNLNRLSRLVPCGKVDFTFTVKPGTL